MLAIRCCCLVVWFRACSNGVEAPRQRQFPDRRSCAQMMQAGGPRARSWRAPPGVASGLRRQQDAPRGRATSYRGEQERKGNACARGVINKAWMEYYSRRAGRAQNNFLGERHLPSRRYKRPQAFATRGGTERRLPTHQMQTSCAAGMGGGKAV